MKKISFAGGAPGKRALLSLLPLLLLAPVSRADEPAIPPNLPEGAGRLAYFADAVRQKKAVTVAYFRGTAGEETTAAWLKPSPLTKAIADQGGQVGYRYAAGNGAAGAEPFAAALPLLAENPDLLLLDATLPEQADAGASQALGALEKVIREAWGKNPRMAIVLVYSPSEAQAARKLTSLPGVAAEHRLALLYQLAEIDMTPAISAAEISGTCRQDEIFDSGFALASRGYELYQRTLGEKLLPALNWTPGNNPPPALPPPAAP